MGLKFPYKTPILPGNTAGVPARGTSLFPAAEDHDHGITAGGMAIGGTVTSGTPGDILIVGAGPVLAQETPATLAGTLDHGLLLGLTDDDHALYLLASDATSRVAFAANWTDLTDAGTTTLHSHTVGSGTISNAMLADMAAWTFKIRNAGTVGVPSNAGVGDLTASTPVAADFVLGFKADGTIRKYAAADFGVTGGGSVVASMGRTFLFMGA